MDFGKTQPIAVRPSQWVFSGNRVLRHIDGDSYEWITLDGKHVAYAKATSVVYASSLEQQRFTSR